jgi:hypothetical protein
VKYPAPAVSCRKFQLASRELDAHSIPFYSRISYLDGRIVQRDSVEK